MRSPTSLTCRPQRHFGAVALHNRALRIIRILQLSAKRGVRAGNSPGTSPRRLGARTSEWPAPGPTTHSSPPRRPSAKAPACRHQQIRNRSPLANRPDLRPSHLSAKLTLNQVRPDDLTHPSRKLTTQVGGLRLKNVPANVRPTCDLGRKRPKLAVLTGIGGRVPWGIGGHLEKSGRVNIGVSVRSWPC